MPCTTWERFMHRALDVKQTKKRQMCGTKSISGNALCRAEKVTPIWNTASEKCTSTDLVQTRIWNRQGVVFQGGSKGT